MIYWKNLFTPQKTLSPVYVYFSPDSKKHEILSGNLSVCPSSIVYTEQTVKQKIIDELCEFFYQKSYGVQTILDPNFDNFPEDRKIKIKTGEELHNLKEQKNILKNFEKEMLFYKKHVNMQYNDIFWYSNINGIFGDQPLIVVEQNNMYGVYKHPNFNYYGLRLKNEFYGHIIDPTMQQLTFD